MSILDQIIAYKRDVELPTRRAELPLVEMRARALAAPPALDFISALRSALPGAHPPRLIAEIKRASPSKGLLCPQFDPLRLAEAYQAGGAAAVSVLTDVHFFQGGLDDLRSVRQRFPRLPLLRKDFILDPYQVYETRAAGADALLLIAAALQDDVLNELLALTCALGMAALIEVHDEVELQRALACSPRLVGVNNRNLRTFQVDLSTCLSLRALTPREVCFVAESGIHTRADVQRLASAGIDAMLIGEALVTAPDIDIKMKELIGDHAC